MSSTRPRSSHEHDRQRHLAVPSGQLVRRTSSKRNSSRLCSTCSTIKIDRYLAERMRIKPLGTARDLLRRSYCPFCRLVIRCLGDNLGSELRDELDQTVILWTSLSWEESIEVLGWDGVRSSSYSNKYDLRSADKAHSETRAYRFMVGLVPRHSAMRALYGKKPAPLGSIQYLADKEPQQADRTFYGRSIQQDRVDLNLLRSWLGRCEHWHSGRCGVDVYAASGLPRNLRFIDIQNRRVVKASSAHEYVALSYVWGEASMMTESKITMPKLLRKNIQHDRNRNESTPLPDILPRTLEDALSVTRALGYDYLWNDALCIIQDDDQDTKQIHLSAMDAIYSRAVLTIAAASGHHADYGLPGISCPRKYQQYREKVDGLHLASMFPAFSDIEDWAGLVWNTRGWTLQEKLLSKRILFFTDWQVYFKCSEAIWTEEVCSETGRLSKSIQARPNKYGWAADRLPRKIGFQAESDSLPKSAKMLNGLVDSMAYHIARMDTRDAMQDLGFLVNYAALVERFSRRQLSHHDDSLFAIEGILRTFNSPLYAGLPSRFFREALLWHSNAVVTTHSISDAVPTWSWTSHCSRGIVDASHKTAVVVNWDEDDLLNTEQSITKYSIRSVKNLDAGVLSNPKVFSALQPVSQTHYIYRGLRERVRRASESGNHADEAQEHSLSRYAYELSFKKPLLRMQSWVLSLGIKVDRGKNHTDRTGSRSALEPAQNLLIVDADGKCCGEVTTSYSMARRSLQPGACDFLVVSWGRMLSWVGDKLDPSYIPKVEETRGGYENEPRRTVQVNQSRLRWRVANVLLITYMHGIAYRVGIGKVIITAWHKAKPQEVVTILG